VERPLVTREAIRAQSLVVRPFAATDTPAVRAIEEESFPASRWPDAEYAAVAGGLYWGRVAELDGHVAGFLTALAVPGVFEILNVAVTAAARRRGLGRRLIAEAEVEARALGAACVLLEVRESNRGAQEFYRVLGFRIAGRRQDYYREPVEDALLLTLTLTRT